MSGGKRLLLSVLVLFLVTFSAFSVDEEFLTALEKELTTLDNALMTLGTESQKQRNELENLSNLSMTLQTQVQTLQNQLDVSQTEATELREQSDKLKEQWGTLETSLQKSVKEMQILQVKNKILLGGVIITLAASLGAIIYVIIK